MPRSALGSRRSPIKPWLLIVDHVYLHLSSIEYIYLWPIDIGTSYVGSTPAADVGKIIIAARPPSWPDQTELAHAIGATQSWVSEVEQERTLLKSAKYLEP